MENQVNAFRLCGKLNRINGHLKFLISIYVIRNTNHSAHIYLPFFPC